MTKEELVKLGLPEDLAKTVAEASATELKEFIPKSRFNEVSESNKTLKTQMADRDKQLDTLKKASGDAEALKTKIEELQAANKTASEEHEAQIRQIRMDHAVESALTGAKAKNIKAVRALLNLDDLDVDDDGKVKGLDKQIKKLAEADDTKFLFDAAEDAGDGDKGDPAGKPKVNIFGMNPADPDTGNGTDGQSLGASFAAQYNSQIMPVQAGATGAQK